VAAEPGTGLITDCEMTMAAGQGSSDAENAVKMAGRDRFSSGGAGPQDAPGGQDASGERWLELYGDSAYGSGQARAEYQAAGHDTVIRPGPLRPAVPGGFTVDDFVEPSRQTPGPGARGTGGTAGRADADGADGADGAD